MKGQVAVVTGGSGGIGSEICRHFAEAGCTVAFTYRTGKQAAERILETLPGTGHWATRVAVDDSVALQRWRPKWRRSAAAATFW